MFKCKNCGITVPTGQPMNKVVTKRREKTYERTIKHGYDRGRTEQVRGWEIVEEIATCPQCTTALTGREVLLVEQKPEKKFFPKFKKEYKKDRYNNDQQPRRDKQLDRVRDRERRDPRGDNNYRPQEKRKPVVEVINPIKTIK